jgi:DNA-directed RNA polymerase specialized sigma24 family protein
MKQLNIRAQSQQKTPPTYSSKTAARALFTPSLGGNPPNVLALDALIASHWKPLFARCQMMTVNPEQASNLAQAALLQILQTGCGLHPVEDFRAHLIMTATNLWRQQTQALHLVETVVAHREFSVDNVPFVAVEEEAMALGTIATDLKCLSEAEQAGLEQEIDAVLFRLTPSQRDAVLSYYLNGESCADIGHRYTRT